MNWKNNFLVSIAFSLIVILSCSKSNEANPLSSGNTFIVEFENGYPEHQPDPTIEFKNYLVGPHISGIAAKTLLYAKNMGYKYVFYQSGMESCSNNKGIYFFVENPQLFWLYNLLYTRPEGLRYGPSDWGFYSGKSYNDDQKSTLAKYVVRKSTTLSFNSPVDYLASCWFTASYHFNLAPCFQQDEVINEFINGIFSSDYILRLETSEFKFAGFGWDVPNLSGDFWTRLQTSDGSGYTSLDKWNPDKIESCAAISDASGTNNHYHNYPTFPEGMAKYYMALMKKSKNLNNSAKFIINPCSIEKSWINQVQGLEESEYRNFLLSDDFFIMEEDNDLEFFKKNTIYIEGGGWLKHSNVGSAAMTTSSEYENRLLCANAAINNSWFNWYGGLGGHENKSGSGVSSSDFTDIPSWCKLIRVLANWDNLAGATSRSWDPQTGIYSSSNSYMDGKVVATRNPYSGKLFITFMDKSGTIPLDKICSDMDKIVIKSVKTADAYMGELTETKGALVLNSDILKLAD